MHFIEIPNLPQSKVRLLVTNGGIGDSLTSSLESLGIKVLRTKPCSMVSEPIARHPDIQLCHLGSNKVVVHNYLGYNNELIAELVPFGISVEEDHSELKKDYPADIAFNCLRVGNKLFCKKEYTSEKILNYCREHNIEIINIKQGYAKCSSCVVTENAIITADHGLAAAVRKEGIEVLLIREGHISLPGYPYGFIGGASFKMDKETLCFTGNIKIHPDYEDIHEFLRNFKVNDDSLSLESPIDYGSFIPLMECDEY